MTWSASARSPNEAPQDAWPDPERPGVPRPIVGFHTDAEGHWVAELACGHGQHVRHDPPWQLRPWVTTAEGRARFLGVELVCVRCGGPPTPPAPGPPGR